MTTASAKFRSDIEISLGGSLIDVELTEADYNFALDKAKRIFQQRGNNNLDRKFISFTVEPDKYVYTLPSSENIDTVVKIIRPRTVYSSADPFYSSFIQEFWGNFVDIGDQLAEYELGKQTLKQFEKYTLYDVQFSWKKRKNELSILNNPKMTELWAVEVYADLTDEEYEDVMWVRDYAMAEAKILLGNAYRKFTSLTTPSGETSLEGNTMISEGKEEQATLLENISDYVDGDPTGSIIVMG